MPKFVGSNSLSAPYLRRESPDAALPGETQRRMLRQNIILLTSNVRINREMNQLTRQLTRPKCTPP